MLSSGRIKSFLLPRIFMNANKVCRNNLVNVKETWFYKTHIGVKPGISLDGQHCITCHLHVWHNMDNLIFFFRIILPRFPIKHRVRKPNCFTSCKRVFNGSFNLMFAIRVWGRGTVWETKHLWSFFPPWSTTYIEFRFENINRSFGVSNRLWSNFFTPLKCNEWKSTKQILWLFSRCFFMPIWCNWKVCDFHC